MCLFIKGEAVVIKYSIQDIIVPDMAMRHRVKVVCDLLGRHLPVFIILGVEPFNEESAINQNCHFDWR